MNLFLQWQKHGRWAGIVIPALIILLVTIAALFLSLVHPFRPIANILLYHSISDHDSGDPSLVIAKKHFARQMKYIFEHGYEPVFLSCVIQTHKEGKNIPSNWIVLTFDDGKADFYSAVYPLLKAYGFKVVLFVSPGRLEPSNEFCTWAQLKEMKNSGLVEIGAHGLYHDPLTRLSPPEAEYRLARSKAILEEKLGGKITLMAYPYGAFSDQVRELVKKAGYEAAVGTVYPRGKFKIRDIYNMRRVHVTEISRYPFMFRFMLSGYYVPIRGLLLRLMGIDAPRDVNAWNSWTNSVFSDE